MTDNLISFENEIWKPVEITNGRFLVSNMGRVFCIRTGKLVSLRLSTNGYKTFRVSIKNKFKDILVHRAILEAFVGESDLKVDHINGNKHDNLLSNLEYVSQRENVRRSFDKLNPSPLGRNIYSNKSKKNPYRVVFYLNKKRQYGGSFSSIKKAEKARDVIFKNLGIT